MLEVVKQKGNPLEYAAPDAFLFPVSQTMDVYNAFSAIVREDVPAYLMSTVKRRMQNTDKEGGNDSDDHADQ